MHQGCERCAAGARERWRPVGSLEAVILNHIGNAHRHGLPNDEREWRLAGRRREGLSIPIKDCPVCLCSCPSAAQVCPDCSHLFLTDERNEQRRALQQVEGELGVCGKTS